MKKLLLILAPVTIMASVAPKQVPSPSPSVPQPQIFTLSKKVEQCKYDAEKKKANCEKGVTAEEVAAQMFEEFFAQSKVCQETIKSLQDKLAPSKKK